jgi:hypothetical protein
MATHTGYSKTGGPWDDQYVPASPSHEGEWLRLHHKDIGDLEADQLWAEASVLRAELARRIYTSERPYRVGDDITDRDWLRCRIGRLKAELARRQGRAA